MNKYNSYKNLLSMIMLVGLTVSSFVQAKNDLADAINLDYQDRLGAMFKDFHANPELSTAEFVTAKKMAKALRNHGFDVTESVGGTGIVALLENGPGPLVMMRADMDGLPVKEMSGLPYASKATQLDPITNKTFPVMHACGHDVHITSLIGTAKQMVDLKEHWSGTLMLIGQPAEERVIGARAMMEDNLWQRFGKPDYALAFHVSSILPSGVINVVEGAPFAGADTVDIYVRGIGAHGASPHAGKDPIVLGSQIVMALQTLVSRELSPRQPGVVTVGAFHSGSKHNIISELAHLQLTVRNTNLDTRDTLLKGIKRIAENLGRAAGLPEDKLPEVVYSEESTPPTVNNAAMARRLKQVWEKGMGKDRVTAIEAEGMGAEDFPFFTTDPEITSVYFSVGGTNADYINAARNGTGPAVPSHHSPIFKIEPKPAVTAGIEATVLALMDLFPTAN
jgi:amidohydrolase